METSREAGSNPLSNRTRPHKVTSTRASVGAALGKTVDAEIARRENLRDPTRRPTREIRMCARGAPGIERVKCTRKRGVIAGHDIAHVVCAFAATLPRTDVDGSYSSRSALNESSA